MSKKYVLDLNLPTLIEFYDFVYTETFLSKN